MHVTGRWPRRWRGQGLEVWDAECLRPHYEEDPVSIGWTGWKRVRDEARVMVGEKRLRTWLTYMAGSRARTSGAAGFRSISCWGSRCSPTALASSSRDARARVSQT